MNFDCIKLVNNSDYPYMYLAKHQIFLQWFWLQQSNRMLLFHDVGTGKTLTAMNIAAKYKDVIIIGYTKDNIKNDIIRHLLLNVSTKEDHAIMKTYLEENNTYDYKLYQQRLFRKIGFSFYGFQEFVNVLFSNKYPDNITYDELETLVRSNTLKPRITITPDTLIIVDESHNLYNSNSLNSYGKCVRLVCNLFNCKLIMLSATPINNNVREVYSLASLLAKDYDNNKMVYDPAEYIKNNLCVSRVISEEVSFPEIRYIGERKYDEFFCNTVDIDITDKHFEEYVKKIERYQYKNKELTYFSVNRQAGEPEFDIMDSILNDIKNTILNKNIQEDEETAEPEDYFNYEKNNISTDITSKIKTGKGSQGLTTVSKLEYLKEFIKGKQFIYTKYVSTQLHQIASTLEDSGYIQFKESPNNNTRCNICNELIRLHKDDHLFEAKRYAIISGTVSDNDREEIKTIFNSFTNTNGKYIKCIIGSQVLEESTELLCVNNIYLINIPNNISTLKQIIGRVARRNSHAQLPEALRYVNVHVLCAVFTKEQKTTLANINILSPDQSYFLKNSIEYQDIKYFEDLFTKLSVENQKYDIDQDAYYYNPVFHKPYTDRILAAIDNAFTQYKALSEDAIMLILKNKCINNIKIPYDDEFIKHVFRHYVKQKNLTLVNNIYIDINTKRTHFLEAVPKKIISLNGLLDIKLHEYKDYFYKTYNLLDVSIKSIKSIYENIIPLFREKTIIHFNHVFHFHDNKSPSVTKLFNSITHTYVDKQPYQYIAVISPDMTISIKDNANIRSTGINCGFMKLSTIDAIINSFNLSVKDQQYVTEIADTTNRIIKCDILLTILIYMHITDKDYFYIQLKV